MLNHTAARASPLLSVTLLISTVLLLLWPLYRLDRPCMGVESGRGGDGVTRRKISGGRPPEMMIFLYVFS